MSCDILLFFSDGLKIVKVDVWDQLGWFLLALILEKSFKNKKS